MMGMAIRLEMRPVRPLETKLAEKRDILAIAKRVRQKDSDGNPKWAFGGGAAAKLFSEESEIVVQKTGERRKTSNLSLHDRECKDLDVYVFSPENPFLCSRLGFLKSPFFNRFITQDGVCIETTKDWYFYNSPPQPLDVVDVVSEDAVVSCLGPEYLCASHFKAMVEGRQSSTKDVHRVLMKFEDFDHGKFEEHVLRAPISKAFTLDQIRELMKAVVDAPWQAIGEISVSAIKKYYSELFGAAKALDAMPVMLLRKLANGVGCMGTPTLEEKARMPTVDDSESSFWRAVYSRFMLRERQLQRILDNAMSEDDDEQRINTLISIAMVLQGLKVIEKMLARSDADGQMNIRARKVGDFMIEKMEENPEFLIPLRNTFIGSMRMIKRDLASGRMVCPGALVLQDDLEPMIKHLTRGATVVHKLKW